MGEPDIVSDFGFRASDSPKSPNALGQRITKTDSTGFTRYIWDGLDILLELDEHNDVKRRYTHGHTPIEGVSSLIDVEDAQSNHYFYHFDQVGGVHRLSDISEAIANLYEFSPFGRMLQETGSAPNDFVFPSNSVVLTDRPEIRLARVRSYRALQGCWTSRDPVGWAGDYRSLASNPGNVVDPSSAVAARAIPEVRVTSKAHHGHGSVEKRPAIPTDKYIPEQGTKGANWSYALKHALVFSLYRSSDSGAFVLQRGATNFASQTLLTELQMSHNINVDFDVANVCCDSDSIDYEVVLGACFLGSPWGGSQSASAAFRPSAVRALRAGSRLIAESTIRNQGPQRTSRRYTLNLGKGRSASVGFFDIGFGWTHRRSDATKWTVAYVFGSLFASCGM